MVYHGPLHLCHGSTMIGISFEPHQSHELYDILLPCTEILLHFFTIDNHMYYITKVIIKKPLCWGPKRLYMYIFSLPSFMLTFKNIHKVTFFFLNALLSLYINL